MNEVRPLIVSTWFGAFLIDRGTVAKAYLCPAGEEDLLERAQLRRDGHRTPEELQLLADLGTTEAVTRDRRLVGPMISIDFETPIPEAVWRRAPAAAVRRSVMLAEAARALNAAWDPSVHVDEAVRSLGELDHVHNLLSERVASWSGRDVPPLEDPDPLASPLVPSESNAPPPTDADPELLAARAQLVSTTKAIETARRSIERALEGAVPRRSPNLSALLGPLLAARILSLAGGLDRLSRLPASTIQVLGAERAFFEHLRGRAPPPRHGVLFLHPKIQSAPRRLRGKLARALAGKAAIAARLDRAGRPVDPSLVSAFTKRAEAVRAQPAERPSARRRGRSRLPLHRAADDR